MAEHTPLSVYLLGLTCSFLATLLYLNSLNGALVFDDTVAIVSNTDLRPTSPWSDLLSHDFWGYKIRDNSSHKSYRPLCSATFKLNYHMHELEPLGYHMVNIVLYALVCFLFVLLSARVFRNQLCPVVVSGVLFSVHPVHSEAVSYLQYIGHNYYYESWVISWVLGISAMCIINYGLCIPIIIMSLLCDR